MEERAEWRGAPAGKKKDRIRRLIGLDCWTGRTGYGEEKELEGERGEKGRREEQGRSSPSQDQQTGSPNTRNASRLHLSMAYSISPSTDLQDSLNCITDETNHVLPRMSLPVNSQLIAARRASRSPTGTANPNLSQVSTLAGPVRLSPFHCCYYFDSVCLECGLVFLSLLTVVVAPTRKLVSV